MYLLIILLIISLVFIFLKRTHIFKKINRNFIFKACIGVAILILLLSVLIKKEKKFLVETELVKRRTITEIVSASGKIQPEVEIKISSDVSGEIIEVFISEGDKVEQGELLLKIKPDIYKSILERANASLSSAKANLLKSMAQFSEIEANYFRKMGLYYDDAISKSEFEQIESTYKVAKLNIESSEYAITSAKASLKEAQENLDKTLIYAPISGTISRLNVELGERVVGTAQMSGTELLRLANLSNMEVSVEVNENDIIRVSRNDDVTIEVDAFLGQKFKGKVTEIASSANIVGISADQVTNFQVKIRLESELLFRPGMTATVDIITNKVKNELSVPIQAVTTRKDTSKSNIRSEYVFLYENGKTKLTRVYTGIQDLDYIQINSGLDEKSDVIIGPYSLVSKFLENDMNVRKSKK